jgi:hypothetical protein
MKNRLLTGLILSLLVVSVSCKSSDSETTSENTSTATETKTLETSSPQEVLTKHLDAYFQGDFKTSYAYISDKDKTVKALSEYRKEKEENFNKFKSFTNKTTTYRIESTEIKEDTANAKIYMTMPDVEKMVKEVMLAVAFSAQGKSEAQTEKMMFDAIQKQYGDKPPMLEIPQTIDMVKENGEWRVFFDWANPKAEAAEKDEKVYAIGEEAPLMTSPALGSVDIKVTGVRYIPDPKEQGQMLAILDVDVINKLKELHHDFSMGLYQSAIFAKGGNKYPISFDYIKGIDPGVKKNLPMGTVNPGKRINGEIVFKIDKDASDLVLTMDAGYSPREDGLYESDKKLKIKLDK